MAVGGASNSLSLSLSLSFPSSSLFRESDEAFQLNSSLLPSHHPFSIFYFSPFAHCPHSNRYLLYCQSYISPSLRPSLLLSLSLAPPPSRPLALSVSLPLALSPSRPLAISVSLPLALPPSRPLALSCSPRCSSTHFHLHLPSRHLFLTHSHLRLPSRRLFRTHSLTAACLQHRHLPSVMPRRPSPSSPPASTRW